jgi:hypothetical protein
LIRYYQYISREPQRIAPRDARLWRRQLVDHHRLLRMGDVNHTETSLFAFVRYIKDAPTVRPLLDGHSFAAVAIAVQIAVPHQFDVFLLR